MPGISFQHSHRLSPSLRRLIAGAAVMLIAIAATSCSAGASVPPAGAQDPSESSGVKVPDDISQLDSDEVERRLARLLGGDTAAGQAAPEVQPTTVTDDRTLQEILDLLNAAGSGQRMREIVFSVSPQTLSDLRNPVLTIKTPPLFGVATVTAPNRILYTSDGTGDGSDLFEYQLSDGSEPVFTQVVEIRP